MWGPLRHRGHANVQGEKEGAGMWKHVTQAVLLVSLLTVGGCMQSDNGVAPDSNEPGLTTAKSPNAGSTASTVEPLDFVAFGCTEAIQVTGRLHVVSRTTLDARGGVHSTIHSQAMGVSGVGSISGVRYRGTGVTRTTTNVSGSGFPLVSTDINNFRLIGEGEGENFHVHATVHTTINANGVMTAEVQGGTIECK